MGSISFGERRSPPPKKIWGNGVPRYPSTIYWSVVSIYWTMQQVQQPNQTVCNFMLPSCPKQSQMHAAQWCDDNSWHSTQLKVQMATGATEYLQTLSFKAKWSPKRLVDFEDIFCRADDSRPKCYCSFSQVYLVRNNVGIKSAMKQCWRPCSRSRLSAVLNKLTQHPISFHNQ